MASLMRTPVTPVDRESPFSVEELFFSTTDRRGVIRAGNDVFVRVSRYAEDELRGSAHNIIRHPDMPRAVFRLLWDTLAAGEPIAAYVKNMAADGSHYWVMATVVPCGDGFLSVRLKPTSPLLPVVAELYAAVRAAERRREEEGVPAPQVAEESLPHLGRLLAEAGFPDYASFMRHALPVEVRAREDALAGRGRPAAASGGDGTATHLTGAAAELRRLFGHVERHTAMRDVLRDSTRFVMELADDIRLSATNGIIAARRLDAGGATLAVVADEMSRSAGDIAAAVGGITADIDPAMELLADLGFRLSAAAVQVDVAVQFAGQVAREDDPRRREDLREIVVCLEDALTALMGSLTALEGHIAGLRTGVRHLATRLRTLGALQLAGRVEVASVPDAGGFAVLFDQVRERIAAAEVHLAALGEAARSDGGLELSVLERHVSRLRHLTSPAAVTGPAGVRPGRRAPGPPDAT